MKNITNLQNRHKETREKGGAVLWTVVILGIIVAIFATIKLASNTETEADKTQESNEPVSQIEIESDWVKGNTESDIVLVEYADFQCPACAAYHPIVKKLYEEFGTDVKFVFRHFPLRQIHPNANIAAIAAESAGAQGKFWEMHDMIFENQRTWSRQRSTSAKKIFASYAEKLELDVEKFKSDSKSKEIRKILDDSYRNASRARINSTPTFLLNGEKIITPRNYKDFKKLLDEALQAKTSDKPITNDTTNEPASNNS